MTGIPSEKSHGFQRARLAPIAVLAVLFAAIESVSALNMSAIVIVITNVSNKILPGFLDLVVAALPLIVVLAIIGFIVAFLDRILGMLKL